MTMQRKLSLLTIAILLTLAITSYLSPWWTLNRMQSAIASRNYDAFSSRVDYASLHASFKSQMMANARGSKTNGDEGILGAITEGIAGTLAGPMLDVVLSAAGVIEMINQGTPTIRAR
jgi:hypothetical protein